MKDRLLAAAVLFVTAAPAASQTMLDRMVQKTAKPSAAPTSSRAAANANVAAFPFDIAGVRLGMTAQEAKAAMAKAGYRIDRDGLSYGPSFTSTVKQQAEHRRTGGYVTTSMVDQVVTRIEATGPLRESVKVGLEAAATGASIVTDVRVNVPVDKMTGPALLRQAVAKYGKPDGGNNGGMTLVWCSAPMKSICGRINTFYGDWRELPHLQADTILNDNLIELSEGSQREKERSQEMASAVDRAAPKSDHAAF